MKKVTFAMAALAVFSLPLAAQTYVSVPSQKNTIDVTGQAEIEVAPDELYFTVALREYYEDEKNQKKKEVISNLEKQLIQAVSKAGLPAESLTVTSVGGGPNYVERKKKPATFLETKTYELKVSSPEKLDGILAQVDSRGISYAHINRVDHSRKEALKKEVKINALKAAKEKAAYLVEALGEKLGPVKEIKELEDFQAYPQMYARAANMAMAEMKQDEVTDSTLEFKKIKFSYRMQTVFEIQPR